MRNFVWKKLMLLLLTTVRNKSSKFITWKIVVDVSAIATYVVRMTIRCHFYGPDIK